MKLHGDYHRDGYALVEGLVPREIGHAFLRRLKEDVEKVGAGFGRSGPGTSLLRREAFELYGWHYPPMLALLWGLTPAVAALTGRDLLPSYDYLRIYREGDICRVHSDRPACEHSLSLTLDYSDGVPWPLEISPERLAEPSPQVTEDFAGAPYTSHAMQPGDALLYQGVHHRHGRITPNPNGWSAHLFLHWVERGGPYADAAFDGKAEQTRPVNLSF